MKTKSYRCGNVSGRTYVKPVGNGFETGFIYGGKPVFVGNFIHPTEANRWFGIMNREIQRFGRRYTAGVRIPTPWMTKLLNHHLYKVYYMYLDKLFARYNRVYRRAVTRDLSQYRTLKRKCTPTSRKTFLKAA